MRVAAGVAITGGRVVRSACGRGAVCGGLSLHGGSGVADCWGLRVVRWVRVMWGRLIGVHVVGRLSDLGLRRSGLRGRMPARHQAHGHGVAQQATQDQHEDEEDGQSGAHAANLSDATPVAP